MSHGVAFFNSFRDLTASGFWTSKMGIKDIAYIGQRLRPGVDRLPGRRHEEARAAVALLQAISVQSDLKVTFRSGLRVTGGVRVAHDVG